ncbi:MAG: hypothetical protein JNM55_10510 [Anaerolineales bacterium]|nr:hypothetical protein [Anaerolineales bacterium]
MPENISTKNQSFFLAEWSIFNLLGWTIGFVLSTATYFLFGLELITNPVLQNILPPLAFSLSVGIFQWIILKRFGVDLSSWIFATATGYIILINFYSWILSVAFEVASNNNIPSWVVIIGLAITIPISGAVIGGLQSFIIGKYISKPSFWVKAHIFGVILPAVIAPLAIFLKSFFLNLFYSFDFLSIIAYMRWFVFFGFLYILTVLCTSLLTGKVLLEQSNIASAQ